MRTRRNLNRWATATRNSTVANKHGLPNVALRGLASGGAGFEHRLGPFVQRVGRSIRSGLRYSGMKIGPGGAAGFANGRVSSHASNATRYSGLKRSNEQIRQLFVALLVRLDPGVERRDVLELLLRTQRLGGFRLEVQTRRRPVQERLTAVPPGSLVSAPRGRDRHDREDHHLDDLDELLPTALLAASRPLPLAQLAVRSRGSRPPALLQRTSLAGDGPSTGADQRDHAIRELERRRSMRDHEHALAASEDPDVREDLGLRRRSPGWRSPRPGSGSASP